MFKNRFDISIVVPTHNRAELLIECLESICLIEQFRAEIIVVDDASTDGTEELVRTRLSVPSRHELIFLHNTKNAGAQVSRNRGLEKASAPIVQFVDSDDVLFADGVEQGLDVLMRSSDFDYVYGKVEKCDSSLQTISNSVVGTEYNDAPSEIAGYHWHTMGALYRVDFLRHSVGRWNVELSGSQDWEYQARVKLASARRNFVPAIFGFWRQHDANRVSVTAYNRRYVSSVSLAVQSIARNAANAGVVDRKLMCRLWKRLVLHAIEAGAHADVQQKRALLCAAYELPFEHSCGQSMLEFAVRHAPTPLNAWFLRQAPRLQNIAKTALAMSARRPKVR